MDARGGKGGLAVLPSGPGSILDSMAPPRVPLCALPTPLHRLPRASRDLGVDLWIKRDDLTGFAGGGNKGRKLEFLMADALEKKVEVIVSAGSVQSNYLRQLSCACMMFGIHCAAAAMELPYDGKAGKPQGKKLVEGGNRVLDAMFGLDMRVFPDGTFEENDANALSLVKEFEGQGKKVMKLPTGGSTPLGAYAYYVAGQELEAQSKDPFDFIVTASSSGATHAGLGYYFHGHARSKLIGVSCDPEPEMVNDLAELVNALDEIARQGRKMLPSDFDFRLGYYGPGYGVASVEGDAAIEYLIKTEGILLDPIYTGKAFSGLLDMVRKGEIGGRVLFWHTGGLPTLFAR
jgi:1-aminocyclopropane-1-carboxylate deaminase/D-cysteine desulfhydrase-like pyridoxal-dependent ACC family enzyme